MEIELPDGEDEEDLGNWREELRTWGGEAAGNDNFGLTLQELKFDEGGSYEAYEPVYGFLKAMKDISAKFGLGVSGRIQDTMVDEWDVVFEPSLVWALAGLEDANLEGVRFLWRPGDPGGVTLKMSKLDGGPLIVGDLVADLYSDRPYDGRKLKIHVAANFTALEGVLSCTGE